MSMRLLLGVLSLIQTVLFAQPKSLDLKMQYLGHILVEAKINGKYTANLILDSGADELLLDEEYFRKAGIVASRTQRAQLPGAGGEAKAITVVLDRMEVKFDTITFIPRYVPLMDLHSIVGEKADGVIGISFLRDYLTEIDFDNEKLRLYKNREIVNQFEKIELELANNRYYFPVTIQVDDKLQIEGKFQLDLGNGGTLVMNSPLAEEHGLLQRVEKKIKYYNSSGGAGGRVEGYKFRAKAVKVGKFEIPSPSVDWATDTAGALAREDYNGLFGNQILERFRVLVDFSNKALYLKPKKNIADRYVTTTVGFTYSNRNRSSDFLLVTGLYEGGNAEQASLREADEITSIQGIPVKSMNDKQIDAWLKNPGKPIRIMLRRGGVEKEILLKRDEPF